MRYFDRYEIFLQRREKNFLFARNGYIANIWMRERRISQLSYFSDDTSRGQVSGVLILDRLTYLPRPTTSRATKLFHTRFMNHRYRQGYRHYPAKSFWDGFSRARLYGIPLMKRGNSARASVFALSPFLYRSRIVKLK